jgi:mannosyltransferase OCH1-like enzyme
MSLASTNSRIRAEVSRLIPEATICFSTSRLIASAVASSIEASRIRASTMRRRSQRATSSPEVWTKRVKSVVSASAVIRDSSWWPVPRC